MDGVSVSNESLDDSHSFLDMELEALQSIYINEIEVEIDTKSTTVSIDLHPATADKLEEQYVRMTLQFMLDEGYPEDIPKVKIRNPRGLSEEKLNCVMKDLQSIAESKRGSSMLFEMIESAKEHLTAGNRPCGECAICLHGFSDKDIFTKTECYHYFHSNCLARYSKYFLQNSEENETDPHNKTKNNELLCPMCRIPIQFRGSEEDYPPPEASDESHFTLTDEIIDLQKRMTDLFQKQVEKGGIIDIEAEKNKYLIEISDVPTRVNNEERMDQKQLVESDMAAQKTDGSDQVDSPNKEKKYNRDQNQRTDYRGRNRNFNKQNDYRGNYRSGGRYNNKQSYGDFRGNQNRNKYDRYSAQRFDRNRGNSRKNSEDLQQVSENAHDSELQSSDTALSQDFAGSSAQCEDASEIPEHSMCDSKNKPNSSSPRYNRGYRRDNYSYNSRYGDRRSDRSNFQDDQNSHSSHKQSSVDNDAEDTCKSVDKELKERSSEYGEYKKQHYRSDRYRQDNYLPRERYSDSRNSHRGGAIDNEDEEVCKSEYKEPKEKSSEYGEHRKAPYRSDRYRQDNYITRERYSDRNSQRSGVFENEDGDKEKASEYHVRKQHYITDRYRQNNEYDSRDRYMDRNSQRGGRGGYTKRGNYDSHYSGKNRYMDADKDHYYADRDRNFRGRRMPRDDRYRGNNTRDGYRQKSSRNYAGNNFMKQTDENYHQTSTSENHEHADLSSRSQSSDSNHHSVDSGTLDNVSSSDRYSKSLLDKPEAQVEKDISDFDKKSSIKFSDKSADDESYIPPPTALNEKPLGSLRTALNPPPGFANPLKKVIYGLQGANPPPGFNRS